MRVLRVALLAIAFGLLSAACSSKSSGSSPNTTCTNDPQAMVFDAGMAVTGSDSQLKMSLVTAEPAPPAAVYNTWQMNVYPATGTQTAVSGCTINAVASMPQMGHLTNPEPTVTAAGQGYEVSPLNFFMDGLWQVTFTVDCPSAHDTVYYRFCIEN